MLGIINYQISMMGRCMRTKEVFSYNSHAFVANRSGEAQRKRRSASGLPHLEAASANRRGRTCGNVRQLVETPSTSQPADRRMLACAFVLHGRIGHRQRADPGLPWAQSREKGVKQCAKLSY